MVRLAVAIVIISVLACTGGTADPEPTPEADSTDEAPDEVVPGTAEISEQPGYFTAAWALWHAPTDEREIPDPDGDGTIKNYMLNVDRGRPLTKIGESGDWAQVRLEDDTEGWIKSERIVVGDRPGLATVHGEERMFKRPELLALVIDEKIPPGSLLITSDTDGKFTRVDVPTGKYDSEETWVLTENLVTDDKEIEAAKIIRRVMQLREDEDDGAKELAELARGQFADSPLIELLAEPEPEEPAQAEIRPDPAPPVPPPGAPGTD